MLLSVIRHDALGQYLTRSAAAVMYRHDHNFHGGTMAFRADVVLVKSCHISIVLQECTFLVCMLQIQQSADGAL